jgi:hypothetical protein
MLDRSIPVAAMISFWLRPPSFVLQTGWACSFKTLPDGNLSEPQARERALALLALCVGGMVLARGWTTLAWPTTFRNAAYKQARRTAGWSDGQGG